jgi:hypothetical protein
MMRTAVAAILGVLLWGCGRERAPLIDVSRGAPGTGGHSTTYPGAGGDSGEATPGGAPSGSDGGGDSGGNLGPGTFGGVAYLGGLRDEPGTWALMRVGDEAHYIAGFEGYTKKQGETNGYLPGWAGFVNHQLYWAPEEAIVEPKIWGMRKFVIDLQGKKGDNAPYPEAPLKNDTFVDTPACPPGPDFFDGAKVLVASNSGHFVYRCNTNLNWYDGEQLITDNTTFSPMALNDDKLLLVADDFVGTVSIWVLGTDETRPVGDAGDIRRFARSRFRGKDGGFWWARQLDVDHALELMSIGADGSLTREGTYPDPGVPITQSELNADGQLYVLSWPQGTRPTQVKRLTVGGAAESLLHDVALSVAPAAMYVP